MDELKDLDELAFEVPEDCTIMARWMSNGLPFGDLIRVQPAKYVALMLLPDVYLLIRYERAPKYLDEKNRSYKSAYVVYMDDLIENLPECTIATRVSDFFKEKEP